MQHTCIYGSRLTGSRSVARHPGGVRVASMRRPRGFWRRDARAGAPAQKYSCRDTIIEKLCLHMQSKCDNIFIICIVL